MAKFKIDDEVICVGFDHPWDEGTKATVVGVTNFGNFDARNASGEVEVMDEEFWELVSVAQNRASAKLVTPAEPVRPTRKIVQIMESRDRGCMVGLCNDGAVLLDVQGEWRLLRQPVPQPEEESVEPVVTAKPRRENRKVRDRKLYLERNYGSALIRMADGWWRYASTDVDAEGEFDNLHRSAIEQPEPTP